ncbi:hypothetical protein ACF0H5_007431 [Mactra antiquata]
MKLIILFSVIAVGMCAPLSETEQAVELDDTDNEAIRVKRAQEIVMYGNEQNELAKETVKRDDPSIEVGNDNGGIIVAQEPIDLPEKPAEISEEDSEPQSDNSEPSGDEIEETNIEPESQEVNDDESVDNDIVVDDAPKDNTDVATIRNDEDEDDDYGMNLKQYIKELEKIQGGSKGYFPRYPDESVYNDWLQKRFPFTRRYRRSQMRTFNGFPYQAARILKRSHRTKRQTYDPEDFGLYGYDMPFNYRTEEDDIAELLDLLDSAGPYGDNEVNVDPYESYEPYPPYDEPNGLEFESPIYMAPKRQAGLTFVPGIKRNSDFYPYFEEPDTHFAAFVPEKRTAREYADAYERVMALASALREEEEEEEYPRNYYNLGYRKRK